MKVELSGRSVYLTAVPAEIDKVEPILTVDFHVNSPECRTVRALGKVSYID